MFSYIQSIDEIILIFVQNHMRLEILDPVMSFFSFLGNAGILWIVLSILLILFRKTRKIGVLALSSLFVCFLFNNILLKNLISRPRPYTHIPELKMLIECPSDMSFPSGHACSSFATSCSIYWSSRTSKNEWWIPAVIIAVLVAFSRIYVGVHYPSDVLVGCLIGIFGSFIVNKFGSSLYDRAYNYLSHKQSR